MAHVFQKISRHVATLKRRILLPKLAIALVLVYYSWVLWLGCKYIPYRTNLGFRLHYEGIQIKRPAGTGDSREQNNGNILAKAKDREVTELNLETAINWKSNSKRNDSVNAFYGVGCGINPYRKRLQKLLHFWNKITMGRGIEYFICDGSLLGYQRNSDFLPFDHDIDICVHKKHLRTLLKLKSKRPINVKDKQPHLIIPKAFPNKMRLNCEGILVDTKMDPCSIVSPAARVILGDINFIDVYLYTGGETYSKAPELQYEISDVYPTKPCWLAGIFTRCPSKPVSILEKVYGKNAVQNPSHVCKNHQFVAVGLNERETELPWSIRRVNRLILKRLRSKRL